MDRSIARSLRPALTAAAVLCLGSCGGGSRAPVTVTVFGVAALDGALFSNNSDSQGVGLSVGNFGALGGLEARGVATFDLSSIPPGASVTSAIVTIDQAAIVGADPYPLRGSVVVDHVDVGGSLDGSEFAGGLLTADIGTLSIDATLGLKSLDVTAAVQADVAAARVVSSFRLQFQSVSVSPSHSFASFGDAEGSNGATPPSLLVTYVP